MTSEFHNEVVPLNRLPQVEEIIYTPLNAQYKKVVFYQSLIAVLIFAGIGSIPTFYPFENEALFFLKEKSIFILLGCTLFALLILVVSMLSVKCKGYAVRQHDLVYKSGLISKSITIIPYNRVQHLELYEGAISRLFNLCQLELFTAGGTMGDLKVPGLSKEEAERIKTYIVAKVQPLQVESNEEVKPLQNISVE
ncbi:MAG: PH domain-containing protein [Flavobacteriaceae bacterium]|jgi:membrane protein YdbS with pleckstrin-like domain|nr:PH domain-containing protein [Flavobacteriaceae bacterium]